MFVPHKCTSVPLIAILKGSGTGVDEAQLTHYVTSKIVFIDMVDHLKKLFINNTLGTFWVIRVTLHLRAGH